LKRFNNTNDQSLSKLAIEKLIVILRQIANPPDQSRFVDWRQDLFTDTTNIGSCISFIDALQWTISIRMSFIWTQKKNLVINYVDSVRIVGQQW